MNTNPSNEVDLGGLVEDSGGYKFLTTKSITGGKPLTAAMLDESIEAMKQQPQSVTLVDQHTYDVLMEANRKVTTAASSDVKPKKGVA